MRVAFISYVEGSADSYRDVDLLLEFPASTCLSMFSIMSFGAFKLTTLPINLL